ncbi:hypothetical protein QC762_310490 [Podospora pseudocomata]|uniref:Protein kinase domain-containing protein n=1 Tax=Podospora pseudocomata TaxID=2093779 RepID=A0ABR0GL47_9PEZI|nr:hypothetical protein QC762_310490 [Podospora pseudocomata]
MRSPSFATRHGITGLPEWWKSHDLGVTCTNIMELSSTVVIDVLTPLAVYQLQKPVEQHSKSPENEDTARGQNLAWNRDDLIRSLTPSVDPKWRIDGVDIDGRRFFALPLFAIDKQPVRIDVWLPPFEEYPLELRSILKPEEAMYTPRDQLLSLPISKFLLKTLEEWSPTVPGFERDYLAAPFGSRIIIADIAASTRDMTIYLLPDYDIEQNMCSVDQLKKAWCNKVNEEDWPPTIDVSELSFKKQIHEAISLVTLPGQLGDRVVALKSLLRDQRYMYNEIKTLLSLRPHANLVPRPLFLVTKKAKFGGKRGVAGFVMEYFEGGSLKDLLLRSKAEGTELDMRQKLRFARQLTEVLIHVNQHRFGFYPDLKPDNLVIRSDGKTEEVMDLVLLDLEQRGGWFSWSPPEVLYVEYMEILATWLDYEHGQQKQRATERLQNCLGSWEATSQSTRYKDQDGGFSFAWKALLQERLETNSKRLERAQVFMLGKLLWCLFEGEARLRCGIDHEILQENDAQDAIGFPHFDSTPKHVQDMIRECTRGAPEWEVDEKRGRKTGLTLKGGKLVQTKSISVDEVTDTATRKIARAFWERELEQANAFMDELLSCERPGMDATGCILPEAKRRPLLSDILSRLVEFEEVCL